MVRSELIKKICDKHPNLLNKDVEKILKIIFIQISEALSRGENVEIRGFGTYKTIKRKARIGRNPRTGVSLELKSRYTVRFRASKTLLKRLNEN